MIENDPFSQEALIRRSIRNESLELAYKWFIEYIGAEQWDERRRKIIKYLRQIDGLSKSQTTKDDVIPIAIYQDWFGWYLYLIETELYRPLTGDPSQLSRVAPTFEIIGKNLSAVAAIPGIDNIRAKLFSNQNQPDSSLFEILVANCYQRNGWSVEFLPESRGDQKSADLIGRRNEDEIFIECKRLSKATEYSEVERASWGRKWRLASHVIESSDHNIHVNVTFTSELMNVPDSSIAKALVQYIKSGFLNTGKILHKIGFSLDANEIDMEWVNNELSEAPTKPNSPTMIKIISGDFEWWCGYTNAIIPLEIREIGDSELYALNINYAQVGRVVSAKWRCIAKESIDKKAKDVIKRASEAIKQIPDGRTGVIHIAFEAIEGHEVEEVRGQKIQRSLSSIDCKGKNITAFLCHAITNYAGVNVIELDEKLYLYVKTSENRNSIDSILLDPTLFGDIGNSP